ncbi:helix-turn-helix domain-containing protein [Apilactobacillus xinyiensis]|uniref:helix-turn-helix domain-containing protein n=1 Tax=Apilactobacillus xinyiensis TaxID=2841032 RepID=UPI00200D9544|nr:helix-turn-helix transcriptional regulator [Apilactobacillus xinyiensis]MCL0330636.1 helix-turn-helix domain-containing protein [Apilactobacillus xinyiensis]
MFSKNLIYLRKKSNLSIAELSEALKLNDYKIIEKWENNLETPKVIILSKISHFFGITIDDLMEKDLSNY